jgi:hypothetical protein
MLGVLVRPAGAVMPQTARPARRTGIRRDTDRPSGLRLTADALARARAAAANDERFTPEHAAAYAAFAGITDRQIALSLHRAQVTWDDVDGYCAHGVGTHDYQQMITLRTAGVSPAVLGAWREVGLAVQHLPAAVRAGITPAVARPYLQVDEQAGVVPLADRADLLAQVIEAGLSPCRVGFYRRYGVPVPEMIVLHRLGCRPKVVRAWQRGRGLTRPVGFLQEYRSARQAGEAALVNAVLRAGGRASDVHAWAALGLAPAQVRLLFEAGFAPQEVAAQPQIAAADEQTLRAFAALLAPAGAPAS